MSSIKDVELAEKFSSKLEEIRTKLQAMGEVMNETTMEFCQQHKGYVKGILDTCSKKCKEDESMFEAIQAYKDELKRQSSALKEKLAERTDVGVIEDKETQKEVLIQKIDKLRQEQVKNRELIHSQNKANKDRLKNLYKLKELYQQCLSLEIRKIQGEKLQFIFRNIDHNNPHSAFTFLLSITEDGVYQIISSDPPLAQMDDLERRLQETNNFSAFLANVRKEFVLLHNSTKSM